MCFRKSKQSKVLRAKKDIVVYKIGDFADEDTFTPYYMNSFTYKTGMQCLICPDFKSDIITIGFHGYINIIVTATKSPQLHAVIRKKLWTCLRSASSSHLIKCWGEMIKMMYGKLNSFLIIEKNHNILFVVSDLVVSIVSLTTKKQHIY